MVIFATNGHVPYPDGTETTGYEVADLRTTLDAARASGATTVADAAPRPRVIVRFPGGYIAEIHGKVLSSMHE